MKREALGAVVGGVIVFAGAVLLRISENEPRPVPTPSAPEAPARCVGFPLPSDAAARADAEGEVAALRSALAASQERSTELEKRVIALEAAPASSQPEKAVADKKGDRKAGKGRLEIDKDAPPLDPLVADERARAIVEKVDWSTAVRGWAGAWTNRNRRGAKDAASQQAITAMWEAGTEIARLRGDRLGLYRPLSDPLVRERFVPAWIDALGANLDGGQSESVRAQVQQDKASHQNEPAPPTFVARVRRDFADKLSVEQSLPRILRADQLAAYLESVGDDPFFGEKIGQQEIALTNADEVAQALTQDWARDHDLGDRGRAALLEIARGFSAEALRVPAVDPALPLGERRLANFRRALASMDLQLRAEAALAGSPALTDEERVRAREGTTTILKLVPPEK